MQYRRRADASGSPVDSLMSHLFNHKFQKLKSCEVVRVLWGDHFFLRLFLCCASMSACRWARSFTLAADAQPTSAINDQISSLLSIVPPIRQPLMYHVPHGLGVGVIVA